MLIIFSVNDQKITHDLKGQLVAGSVDIVQAAFKFDSSWDELDKIVVFTSSACPKPVPVQFADEAFYIPKDVLKPGKLYVSVVGFGLDGRKKTTQKWDIMQAITVQKSGDYAAVYRLMKDGVAVGAAINIPKDMVVKSGSVVTNPTGQPKGTYIKLVLANATNDTLYVDVGGLIEYVTSGSAAGDMVVITIDEQTHKVTASITDGAITKAKLETEVQTALNKAHEHANAAELDKIATGDKAKWDATSAKVEGIAEGATKVEAGTTEGNIKINGVETAVVTIATDAEVTEMLTEVFGATA